MNAQNILKVGTCAIAGAGLLLGTPALATEAQGPQSDTLNLKPSSRWHLQFADDSCRLARFFGEGQQRTAFYLERYEPGDGFVMTVAGKPFKQRRYRSEISVQFGSHLSAQNQYFTLGSVGAYEPALIFSSMKFADKNEEDDAPELDAAPDVFGQDFAPEAEAAISWIRFRYKKKNAIVLETGSLGDPMKVMRNCTDDLLKHWGIDLDKHKNLARLPEPKTNIGRWVTPKDYPLDLLSSGHQGIVHFRLSVGADGKPTDCHIQQSTRPEGFDRAVCRALMKRARFEPAVTKDGEKIASYWRNTVRFQIPR